jgi:lipoate-protein ligase A
MIYIDTQSTDPCYNFALEEYFCTQNGQEETVFLLWQTQPTVMLGNFQNSYKELNLQAIKRDQVHVVRRNTGGGTIYTDLGGFQFSFIMKGVTEMIDFGQYMDPIIAALAELGIAAEYNSRNDLAIDGKKISGNAQCTKGAYTLHHGSLLYATDFSKMGEYLKPPAYKIKAKGIKSVRERTTNISEHLPEAWTAEEFKQRLIQSILKQGAATYTLSTKDHQAIEQLAQAKFRSWEWTFGKNPKFTLEKEKQCVGGHIEISLVIEEGRITACQMNGDFFASNGVKKLEDLLVGERFERARIKERLLEIEIEKIIYQVTAEELLACLFE